MREIFGEKSVITNLGDVRWDLASFEHEHSNKTIVLPFHSHNATNVIVKLVAISAVSGLDTATLVRILI